MQYLHILRFSEVPNYF